MRECLYLLVLAAVMVLPTLAGAETPAVSGEPIDPVNLVQGWQMVSFPILEPMLLDRFDLLDRTDEIRLPFADAAEPPDPSIDSVLYWYDPEIRGYSTVGATDDVVPNRGYWVYVHSGHALQMVPTYEITEHMPSTLGSLRTAEELGADHLGVSSLSYQDEGPAEVCGYQCQGVRWQETHLGDGPALAEGVDWYTVGAQDPVIGWLGYVGEDDLSPVPTDTFRMSPAA